MKRGRWLLWSKPSMGKVKMNTDGSRKGGRGTTGVLLRGQTGTFFYGFSVPLQTNDILDAELEGILDGILLCHRMNIGDFEIETDCGIAYHMIMKTSTSHWKYWYYIRNILREIEDTRRIRLVFREDNRVADLFAKMAYNFQTRVDFYREEELPQFVQKCI